MTPWFVGQRIVCLDGSVIFTDMTYPHEGSVYTIREVLGCGPHLGFLLEELDNEYDWLRTPENGSMLWGEPGFLSTRFRPLVDTKTSIEMFKRMLTPSHQKNPVSV